MKLLMESAGIDFFGQRKRKHFSILYSKKIKSQGYTYEELFDMARGDADVTELLSLTDLLIDGRFVRSADQALLFRQLLRQHSHSAFRGEADQQNARHGREIGRASCRERV